MGVLLVGNVASKSDVSALDLLPVVPLAMERPPDDLTSQHLTVQSAPPLTKIDEVEDSALNARVWMSPVCPVMVFTQFPDPRSHNLIDKSSLALAR